MSDYVDNLTRQRQNYAKRYRAILDNAATSSRDLSADETAELNRIDGTLDQLANEIVRNANAERSLNGFDRERTLGSGYTREVAATGSNGWGRQIDAIRSTMQKAQHGGFASFESRFSPALLENRALAGYVGTAVATSFADFVTVYERTFSPMLNPNVVTILGREDGSPLVLPRVTADQNHGGTVTAEAGGINELDLTLAQVTLNPYKYGITGIYSAELAEDNTIGLEELIARSAARELSIDIGAHMTTGDGSGKPQGFIGVAANGGTASGTALGGASATFFGWPDMVALYGAVPAPYRATGTFMVSSDAYIKILQFRDNNNNPVMVPGFGDAPATLLGRPIVENPAMATVASASKSIAFGDFSRYVVTKVNPIRVDISRDYKFSTDQLALRTIERVDGDLIDTASVAFLVSANT